MSTDNLTLDAAIKWIEKAQQLGYYNPNVARMIRAGAEAVSKVVDGQDDQSVDHIADNLDSIYARLVNRAGTDISAATAQTYVARTRRLLADFKEWVRDPRGFKPTLRRPGRPPPRPKTPPAQDAFPFGNGAASVATPAGIEYREHTLSLSSGRAYLRVPATITEQDYTLIDTVLKLHVGRKGGT